MRYGRSDTIANDLIVRRKHMEGLEKLKPIALLFLRLALGVIFIFHGYPKLFTHPQQTVEAFVKMGFPTYFAYIAGVFEFFGGILLIAGLFTRIAGLLLAAEMAVALVKVHGLLSNPMNVHNYEFPLACAVGSFALAGVGAGLISLDHAIYSNKGNFPKKSRNKGRD
jgi:putative oxidoreductase